VATRGAAPGTRGAGVTGALSGQRRSPRLLHQLLTGMARGVSAIAQMMMVTMLILLGCQPSGARHALKILLHLSAVNSFVASFCAAIQAPAGDCLATVWRLSARPRGRQIYTFDMQCICRAAEQIHLWTNVFTVLLCRYI
jgi:hypothetical protein